MLEHLRALHFILQLLVCTSVACIKLDPVDIHSSQCVYTSANVENMVMSILGLDPIYCNLGELSPAWLCLQQDRSTMLGKDWTIHHRMRTDKPQNFVRKLLGAGEATAVHFTGTLLKRWCDRCRESKARSRDRRGSLIALALSAVEKKKLTRFSLAQTVPAWPADVTTTVLTFTRMSYMLTTLSLSKDACQTD